MMLSVPITRIIEDAEVTYERVRGYVTGRFVDELNAHDPATHVNVDVLIEGDGLDIVARVFITDASVLPYAQGIAQNVRAELQAFGYSALVSVKFWSGTGFLPSD